MSVKIGVSLVAFKNISEIKPFVEDLIKSRINPYFELSYKLTETDIKSLDFLKGKTLSVHAPCPGTEYYPNFGSSRADIIKDSISSLKKSAETAANFGGDIVVLHPGYTLDVPVYSDYQKRKALLEQNKKEQEYIWRKEGGICKPEYVKSDSYKVHILTTVKNLNYASKVCREQGISLAIENLNPRITYLFQLPDDLIFALKNVDKIGVCLDLGHLWLSSLLYRYNFISAVKRLSETGRVITVHVHNNSSDGVHAFSDDHSPFWEGKAPIEAALKILKSNGVKRFVIESVSEPLESLQRLIKLVG